MTSEVSVVIPVLNAEKYIQKQLDALINQTITPDEILIVDSESNDRTVKIAEKNKLTKILPIRRTDFDHGKTRDMAMRRSIGKYVLFLTQDAEIEDDSLIEKMKNGFSDPKVAVVSARQLPKKDASFQEQLIRKFNYPSESFIRTKKDLKTLGIKTFFMSDVCSMYKKDIYELTGGFEYPLKTNEDMFYAAKVINAGYKIVYDADACVFHSHNFTLKQQYERNYLQGYEMEKHRELLNHVSANSEGVKLVKYVSKELLKKGKIEEFFHFAADCICRYIANRNGHKDARKKRNKEV